MLNFLAVEGKFHAFLLMSLLEVLSKETFATVLAFKWSVESKISGVSHCKFHARKFSLGCCD